MSTCDDHRGDRYTLREELGVGGFGRVFVAFDGVLNREVALKEVRPGLPSTTELQQRLMREVQITGQLEHPGIVPIYDVTSPSADGGAFYTMRLVRGQRLDEAIAEYHTRRHSGNTDPLELPRLLSALISICNAIGYAHARGVMHRDLKPDNVVLGEFGEVVLLDWGLAKVLDDPEPASTMVQVSGHSSPRMTAAADGAMGTPAYMAPEQARGGPGPRTDIYGLGAILFELLTGQPPHDGDDSAEVLQRILSGPTPHVRDIDPRAPRTLDAVCAKAMARDPNARYRTPAEVSDELQRYLADEPVHAFADPWSAKASRWIRRHRASAVAGAVVTLAVVVATSFAAVQQSRLSGQERKARIAAESMRERGVRVAAKFAARSVAAGIDLRWRILEAEAESPILIDHLEELGQADDLRIAPGWEDLQRWLPERHRRHDDVANATSWFLCDLSGRHVARSPEIRDIVGADFAFRDYFHGRGRDLPETTTDLDPIRDVHRSVVFRSKATQNLIVAFSTPVWSEPGDEARRVIGVLAMTVELGTFAALQLDLSTGQTAVLVETESYKIDDTDSTGLVLHHPRLGQGLHALDQETVTLLRALRHATPESAQTGLRRDHLDPLSTAGSPLLAAYEPVFVRGRGARQRDTGWIVIVQEPAAASVR